MRRERRLLLLLTGAIAAGVVVGLVLVPEEERVEKLVSGTRSPGATAVDTIAPQQSTGRIWKANRLERGITIGCAPGPLLSAPVSVRTDADGDVYVLDWTDRCVRRFSHDGVPVRVYGGQAGQGPGEFTNPTDFDVADDGTVWICDPVNSRITVFGPDARLLKTIRPERPPFRIALYGPEGYVLMSSPAGPKLFARYDRRGTLIGTFGVLADQQERVGIALDGRMAGSSDGRFAYAAYRAGVLGLFEYGRSPEHSFVQTIDHVGLPDVVSRNAGDVHYVRVSPDARRLSLHVSLTGDEVHVHAGSRGTEGRGVMDVYGHPDGLYRWSYLLPAGLTVAHVSGHRLYGIADTTVTVWEMDTLSTSEGEAL